MAKPPRLPPAALAAIDAADFCGMSRSTWDTYAAAGLVPEPCRVGAKVVWCRAELEAWLAHGSPPRVEWVKLWPQVRREMLRLAAK